MSLARRTFFAFAAFAGIIGTAQAADPTMFRDAGCGCCLKWLELVKSSFGAKVTVVNAADMDAVKDKQGVPQALRSCHTVLVGGYVIEGHVPAKEIARLLKEKPKGVKGLAVAGMPTGSPGMEYRNIREAYKVMTFGPGGQRVYASYAASGAR
ncbi:MULTISPECIES: DUF411 domain-containing protein [unclassified Sphingopyxis]|uniref:DUF411 domain-containing protein n=1 Tax=unclassified Sphingopyxis TaxID=2614943 RepID=UPI0007366CEE|nr:MULTISPECIES: DUF411 domain-containing protein [unclassified Sphingopyxis]KTE34044.1 metal-binding protein [Sphingopyxis sp. HIX]KTE74443.1 metal-binding protein [Sphingopyxis sp. HXXIV]